MAEAVTEVRGHLTWGTPKSHQHRVVPVPRFLVDDLAALVAGKAPGDLVFTTPSGTVLRNLNWRRDVFDRAATEVGLDSLTPHELRHTAAKSGDRLRGLGQVRAADAGPCQRSRHAGRLQRVVRHRP